MQDCNSILPEKNSTFFPFFIRRENSAGFFCGGPAAADDPGVFLPFEFSGRRFFAAADPRGNSPDFLRGPPENSLSPHQLRAGGTVFRFFLRAYTP